MTRVNKHKKKVVIIGGGTAGLTIANSLQGCFDITVVEKSQFKNYPLWYRPPLFIGILLRKISSRYIFKRNFKLSNGRLIPFFEPNVFGGTSVINGCVHMFGSKLQWLKILERFGFDYSELIDSYSKLYSSNPHAKNKINLTYARQNIIDEAFVEELSLNGIPAGDTDQSNKEACGPVINTVKKYFRTSVLSLLGKKLFKVLLGEKVVSLVFDDNGGIAGVKTDKRVINTDYVILSGGVIGTCSLLLRDKFINDKIADLSIGKGIQDHTNLRINVLTNKNIGSLNEISGSFYQKLLLLSKHLLGRKTLITGTGATTAAHLDLDKDGKIDTRIQIVKFSETGRHGSDGKLFSSCQPGFSISITAINPKSKGEVTVNNDNISIDPMYLSLKDDVELLKKALKFSLKLLKGSRMSRHILSIEEESTIENNPEQYIYENFFSGFHLIGGVYNAIDSNFQIKNTNGLYVCDASVFNEYAASNIHSSVVLIADMFAKKFITNNVESCQTDCANSRKKR